MTGPSKRKGDKAELEVQGMLRENLGVNARRALGAGRLDDMGDIDGVPNTVISVANWADLDRAVNKKLPELEVQRDRAGADFAAMFCRRRGGTYVVVMTPEQWYTLMREVHVSSRADTIRDALDLVAAEKPWTTQDARVALDALLAENQRLRDSVQAFISAGSNPTTPEYSAMVGALAGDAE